MTPSSLQVRQGNATDLRRHYTKEEEDILTELVSHEEQRLGFRSRFNWESITRDFNERQPEDRHRRSNGLQCKWRKMVNDAENIEAERSSPAPRQQNKNARKPTNAGGILAHIAPRPFAEDTTAQPVVEDLLQLGVEEPPIIAQPQPFLPINSTFIVDNAWSWLYADEMAALALAQVTSGTWPREVVPANNGGISQIACTAGGVQALQPGPWPSMYVNR